MSKLLLILLVVLVVVWLWRSNRPANFKQTPKAPPTARDGAMHLLRRAPAPGRCGSGEKRGVLLRRSRSARGALIERAARSSLLVRSFPA